MSTSPALSVSESPAPHCPEHLEQASVAPCARCGRFLCAACIAQEEPVRCAPCAERERDALGILDQPFSVGGALRNGLRLMGATLPGLVTITVPFSILGGLLTYAATRAPENPPQFGSMHERVFENTVGLLGAVACIALMAGVAENRQRSPWSALRETVGLWVHLFTTRWRTGLTLLGYLLLLIVPGILKAASLALVMVIAWRQPHVNPLEESSRLVHGQRGSVLGLLVLAYVGVLVPVFVIGGCTAWLQEAGLLPMHSPLLSIFEDAFARLAGTYVDAVLLSAFYGLKRSHGEELAPLPAGP